MKTGVIGLGIMGSSIARNILAKGTAVAGFDVAPSAMAAFRDASGSGQASATAVAAAADLVLTSLPSASALDETARAIAASGHRGLVVCELSTLPIEVKIRNRDLLAAAGIVLLDCPLSGTGAQAKTGDLAVYASGDQAGYARAKPLFGQFARVDYYLGEFGNGSKMKFVANLLVAIHNAATAEAIVLAFKAGLDLDTVCKVIPTGAGNSRVFELRAPLMAANDYMPPTMKIDVWQKDMAIIGAFAKELGVEAPLFKETAVLYDRAIAQGLGSQDTAAVCAVLEKMAGIERR